jgi:hypothetical protein
MRRAANVVRYSAISSAGSAGNMPAQPSRRRKTASTLSGFAGRPESYRRRSAKSCLSGNRDRRRCAQCTTNAVLPTPAVPVTTTNGSAARGSDALLRGSGAACLADALLTEIALSWQSRQASSQRRACNRTNTHVDGRAGQPGLPPYSLCPLPAVWRSEVRVPSAPSQLAWTLCPGRFGSADPS